MGCPARELGARTGVLGGELARAAASTRAGPGMCTIARGA